MLYRGFTEVNDEQLARYYEGHTLEELIPNQYLVTSDGKALRYDGTGISELKVPNIKGFKAKNVHQLMSLDLLHNTKIPAKLITGKAGSGKTRLALQYGLHALQKGDVSRIFAVRNPAVLGEQIGYLKGDLEAKIGPFFNPVIDNLDGGEQELQRMIENGQIEMGIPGYMQGRDIRQSLIIVDESQLLDIELVKMLGSRVSEGSQVVFLGDTEQIFMEKYKKNNGLRHMIDRLPGQKLFGMIELQQVVRSSTAEMFATLL